jgi:hypothetical protein
VTRLGPTLLVAFLLAGTAVAFAVTQGLKLQKSPVYGTLFDKVGGPREPVSLSFRIRKRDHVTAVVVNRDGDAVRTLFDGVHKRGRITRGWRGTTDEGGLAPDGTYQLRVRLAGEHRTILIPTKFRLDLTPPSLADVTALPDVFSPDGDGRRDRVLVRYRTIETAKAILFVNGNRVTSGKLRLPTRVRPVPWSGELDGKRTPGRYVLRLRLQDASGNRSDYSRPLPVTLRYLEITDRTLNARPGKRFRVPLDTDYRKVAWRLHGRAGTGLAHALRLRAPAKRGAYKIFVGANGHAARATVLVGAVP